MSSRKVVVLAIVLVMVAPLNMGSSFASDPDTPVVPLPSTSPRSLNCNPPGTGPWDIDVETVCDSETLTVNGNITVSAKLELIDTVLSFDNDYTDGYDLKAMTGSELYINGSTVNSTRSDRHFAILVGTGVDFSMNDSVVDGAGWKDLERFSGAASGAERTEYNNYFWLLAPGTTNLALTGDDGIEIRSTPLKFEDNTFRNYTHVRFFSDDNVVEGNTFESMSHEGLAFMQDTSGHVITNNTFRNATRINREIHGVRFYTNNQHVEVANNTFDWIPFSMSISNIPPWTSGYFFDIHHNTYTRAITAFNGNFRYSRMHHETMSNVWKGISIDAGQNLMLDNLTIRDVTFQKDLENVVNQAYYNEVQSRGLLANMAYWMWGFYCSKFMINLGWWGRDITVRDSLFADGPPYTLALNSDQHSGMDRIYILNNTFRNIGTYIPNGYKVRNDWTGYNHLTNLTPISGSAIMLEGSDKVLIEGNIFMKVLNGITTSGPDALGNFGSFEVRNNLLRGVGSFSYTEQRYSGGWWTGANQVNEDGIGLATSIHYINGVGPDWQPWHYTIYQSESVQSINNNTFYDFGIPVAIDLRRDQGRADEMGNKTAVVEDNIILRYIDTQSQVTHPNRVVWDRNVEVKAYPFAFPNVSKLDAHRTEASGRYYVVPGGMDLPDHEEDVLSEWEGLEWTAVGQAGDLEVLYSTDGGSVWAPVPANGSLAGAPVDTNRIRFRLNLTAPFRITGALEYDLDLTYMFNTDPFLQPLADLTASKNEEVRISAQASDADGDVVTYGWEQVVGHPVTIANGTTDTMAFTTNLSGVYEFRVEASDGIAAVNDTVRVSIENNAPTLTADGPPMALKGQNVLLTANASDPDGDPLMYNWTQITGPIVVLNFDDTPSPGFVPVEIGIYKFAVSVSDNEETTGPVEVQVEVQGRPPVANLSLDMTEAFTGDTVTMSANKSEDPDGEIVLYLFDFGDGNGTGWTNLPWAEHIYESPGTFTVNLTVRDDDGNISATVGQEVAVELWTSAPVADFAIDPVNGTIDTLFTFRSEASDIDGSIASWEWDFGDGVSATGAIQTHKFALPGDYTVVHRVTDDMGLEANTSLTIEVLPRPNNPPVITSSYPAKSEVKVDKGQGLDLAVEVADDDGDPITYRWFVDGAEVEGVDGGAYTFSSTAPGTYTVTVEVTDGRSAPLTKGWTVVVRKPRSDGGTDVSLMLIVLPIILAVVAIALLVVMWHLKKKGQGPSEASPVPEGTEPPHPTVQQPVEGTYDTPVVEEGGMEGAPSEELIVEGQEPPRTDI